MNPNATTSWRPAAPTRHPALVLVVMLALSMLAGCATPQQTTSTDAVPLDQAVTEATDSLAAQTQKLPAFIAKLDKRALVIDPMIDSGSGQQTALTRQIEEKVTARLTSNFAQLPVLPFQLANLNRSQYVLTGTTTRLQNPSESRWPARAVSDQPGTDRNQERNRRRPGLGPGP